MRVRATAGSSDVGMRPRLRSTCTKLPNPMFEYLLKAVTASTRSP